MSLKDDIKDELVSDKENILRSEMERVKEHLQIHGDGTIDIEAQYKEDHEIHALLYLIGQYYSAEADLADSPSLSTSFLYDRLPISDRSVRRKLESLRDEGLIRKSSQTEHEIIPENLPDALDKIEERR